MKTIHHVIDFDAPAAGIWSAITEQQGLAAWWSTQVDAPAPDSPGSRIAFTFAGDFNPVMEVARVEPGKELEWHCVGGHGPWDDNRFEFVLHPLDDGRTRVRFWQHYATELSDDQYGTYNFNWGYYMESLRLLCTTGTGKPFDASKGARS